MPEGFQPAKATAEGLSYVLSGKLVAVSFQCLGARQFQSIGNVVGQRIVYDGCNSGLANWGTTSSFRKRTASTCPDPGPNAEF